MRPEAPVMLDLYSACRFGLVRYLFPDRVDIGTIEITRAVPAPTPHYSESASLAQIAKGEKEVRIPWCGPG